MATVAVPNKAKLVGGSFLIEEHSTDQVFTPEDLTEEHQQIVRTTEEFARNEILPNVEKIEHKEWAVTRELLRKACEIGIANVDIPEQYGGSDMDKSSSALINEHISVSGSFSVSFGGHVGIGTLPIVYFGTPEQKKKYLPKLATGELIAAYALSEGTSASDAMNARTKAVLSPDGKEWILNGEKMWITNGGFADVFVVFAKVDNVELRGGGAPGAINDGQFTAFLVERGFGVKSGKEEHKMGLHGSSTTALIFEDVRMPADTVLGDVGKGHKVAFNVLNFARFKLGAMCGGGAQAAIAEAAKYAATRRQFNATIASFGAIKHKIGEMVVKAYAAESLLYRTAGMVDARIDAAKSRGADKAAASLDAFEEYAVEASIAKVLGSETLNYVLDENIQIHGGNGYVKDYPAERHFRDARVNRIFEGTNEINRLLIPGMLIRRALKGDLSLIPAAKALQDELLGPPQAPSLDEGVLADEHRAVESFKKTALMVLGLAMQTFGQKLTDEQEVLMHAADILMDVFAAESAVLRAEATSSRKAGNASLHVDAARVFVNDAALRIDASAKQALAATVDGDMLRMMLAGLRRLIKVTPVNTAALRRRLADETVARGAYPFS